MSRIPSKWTLPEQKLHGLLKAFHVRHKMHPGLPGHPDVLLTGKNLIVFVNGCFWHGCKTHYRQPKSNREFWREKMRANVKRQGWAIRKLQRLGYKVRILWEHSLDRKNLRELFS